ncbi:MAG: glycosyltransferase family 2 protein [Desulfobacterales bacterium]|nr:glycosyltransferase family 2 protein [Desulfobacterales bacterium]
MTDISIVIVSYNTRDTTRECLKRVNNCLTEMKTEVIVVDNYSTDGSVEMIKNQFKFVNLIELKENKGFAAGNSPGMKIAKGRYILLLNPDVYIDKGILTKTVDYMDSNQNTGILGCKLTDMYGKMQPSARMQPGIFNKILHITGLSAKFPESRFFGRLDYTWWDHNSPKNVGWVVGAFFMIRRETMIDLGYLDHRYFLYYEEIDYCLSAHKKGWNVIFFPNASVIHLGGISSKKSGARVSQKGNQMVKVKIKSELRFYRKWHNALYVLLISGVEILWNVAVYFKNSIKKSETGRLKQENASYMIRSLIGTLLQDNFGRGTKPCLKI